MTHSRLIVAILSLLLAIAGCGGGTSGTGDNGSSTVYGKVVTLDGAPVPNASITIAETGASGITNDAGEFNFASDLNEPTISFLIERNEASATAILADAPRNPSTLYVELGFDEAEEVATINRAEVDPQPTPTATPSGPGLIPGKTVLCRVNLNAHIGVLDGVVVRSDQRGVSPQPFVKLGENESRATWGVLMRIPKIREPQTLSFRTRSTLFSFSISRIDLDTEMIRIDGGLYPRGTDDPTRLHYVGVISSPPSTQEPRVEYSPGGGE